jgi:hypothetical protein
MARKLRDGGGLHQRQAEAHHPAAAKAHDPAALAHPGVHLVDQVDLGGHVLSRVAGDAAEDVEQLGVVARLEPRAGRPEAVNAREDRPEDHHRRHHAEEGQLDVDPVGPLPFRVWDEQQGADDG